MSSSEFTAAPMSSARLSVKLLGVPQVHWLEAKNTAGQLVIFRTKKTLALFVYLGLTGQLHAREQLATLLWPEHPDVAARALLRNTLGFLRLNLAEAGRTSREAISLLEARRDALGRDALHLDQSGGWPRLELDTHILEQAVMVVRSSQRSPVVPPPQSEPSTLQLRTALESALAVYRGPFLDGVAFEGAPEFEAWITQQRTYYLRHIETVCDWLSQLQLDSGAFDAAIATARRWTELSPLDEAAARRLMQALASRGERTAALAVFTALRKLLQAELGLEPAPETVALAERLSRMVPAAASPTASAVSTESRQQWRARSALASAPSVHVDTPFAGRATEFETLVTAYETARQGEPQVVVVEGEIGIGKTRLATEFLHWAEVHEADVLHGRVVETRKRLPYQPIVDALRPRVAREHAPDDLVADVWLAELVRLLPELHDRYPDLPAPVALVGDGEAARGRLFEAVTQLGLALATRTLKAGTTAQATPASGASRSTLILFVDDLQWADDATLDLVQYMAHRWTEEHAHVLMLLTLRTQSRTLAPDLEAWVSACARCASLTRIVLQPVATHVTGAQETPVPASTLEKETQVYGSVLATERAKVEQPVAEEPLPIGGFLGARSTGALIAREAELGRILSVVDTVMSGSGRLVLLVGRLGIGKTRLAQEVALEARNRGYLVASGRCYEPEQTVANFPFLEALAHAYRIAPTTIRAELPRQWPEVAQLLPDQHLVEHAPQSSSGATASSNQMERLRLCWAITGFMRALAEHQQVALLLDDLHWADSASLTLLLHLARHTRDSRVLLMGTYRELDVYRHGPLEAMLRDVEREHLVERVVLERFSQEETSALVASLLGTNAVTPELSALLHQRTDGNPFFTQEMLQSLVERGDAYWQDGWWRGRPTAELVVPETVRLVIGQRLAHVAASTKEVLLAASVLGETFTFDELAAMHLGSEDTLELALDEAIDSGLVRESGQESYAFHHVLIQQTCYADLSARRKLRLHHVAGEALERLPARMRERRTAELAYHFARSDDRNRALMYLAQAAEHAHAAAAYQEEATLLGQAIGLAERLEERQRIVDLRGQRGRAFRAIDQLMEADREFVAALEEMKSADLASSDQIQRRIQLLVDLAEVRHFLHQVPSMRQYAAEALELAEQIGREDLAARAMGALAIADTSDGDVPGSLEGFRRAFERAGPGHHASLMMAIDQYGLNLYYLGRLPEAAERSQEILDLARTLHDTTYTGRALGNLGLALTGQGRYKDALEVFAEAQRFAREYGAGPWIARAAAISGGLHLEVFDFAGAEKLAEEARELSRALGFPPAIASTGIDLLLNFARRHEVARTEHLIDEVAEAVARAQGVHGWLWRLRLAQARAETALARGEWDVAIRYADDAIEQSRLRGRVKYQVAGLQTRAHALAALGHTRDAIAGMQRATALARPTGDPAMFLRAAAALLSLGGDDALLADARAAADRIVAALPNGDVLTRFREAEALHPLGQWPSRSSSASPKYRVQTDTAPQS